MSKLNVQVVMPRTPTTSNPCRSQRLCYLPPHLHRKNEVLYPSRQLLKMDLLAMMCNLVLQSDIVVHADKPAEQGEPALKQTFSSSLLTVLLLVAGVYCYSGVVKIESLCTLFFITNQ